MKLQNLKRKLGREAIEWDKKNKLFINNKKIKYVK